MISEKDGRIGGVYVWVQIDGQPVVAGRFEHLDGVGSFWYGNSYIDHPDAFALDPVNLPLVGQREFHTRANKGHFGVMFDAGPDAWGERVLSEISSSRPRNKLEYLLAGNGQGVGQLLFSTSSHKIKFAPSTQIPAVDLQLIEEAAQCIEQDVPIPKEKLPEPVRRVLEDSSWIGGARPKASVTRNGRAYIAKFSRSADTYDQVGAEHACLTLAKDAGFDVPAVDIAPLANGRRVLLVERFDTNQEMQRLHYISANSLLQIEKANELNPDHGYPGLAELVRRFSADPEKDAHELFRRMALRVLIGDTDDHARNHGFLLRDGHWQLAPVFDLLPHPDNIAFQAMPIGRLGRERSLENLLSMSGVFLLSKEQALNTVRKLEQSIRAWPRYFSQSGVPERQIQRLAACFTLPGLERQVEGSEPLSP